jgi:hypothetical protein
MPSDPPDPIWIKEPVRGDEAESVEVANGYIFAFHVDAEAMLLSAIAVPFHVPLVIVPVCTRFGRFVIVEVEIPVEITEPVTMMG